MKPVSPVIPTSDLKEIKVAEHQPEYGTLPVVDCGDGVILSRWKLTDEEKQVVAETGDIYIFMHTFGQPVMPILLQVEMPEVSATSDELLSAEIISD